MMIETAQGMKNVRHRRGFEAQREPAFRPCRLRRLDQARTIRDRRATIPNYAMLTEKGDTATATAMGRHVALCRRAHGRGGESQRFASGRWSVCRFRRCGRLRVGAARCRAGLRRQMGDPPRARSRRQRDLQPRRRKCPRTGILEAMAQAQKEAGGPPRSRAADRFRLDPSGGSGGAKAQQIAGAH